MRGLTTCVLSLLSNKICSCRLAHFLLILLTMICLRRRCWKTFGCFRLESHRCQCLCFWFCFYYSVLSFFSSPLFSTHTISLSLALSLYLSLFSLYVCMCVSFKLSSYKVVMVVAFSLLLFFCLQVAADQFCFMLPLPSPFALSLRFFFLVVFCSSSLVMRKRKSPSRRRDRGWWLYVFASSPFFFSFFFLSTLLASIYLPDMRLCMRARIRMNRRRRRRRWR